MNNEQTAFIKALVCLLVTGCITGAAALPKENGFVQVFFCDDTNCETVLESWLENASSVKCAMYHPTEKIARTILTKGSLVVDEEHTIKGAVTEKGSGLMHNKFCVFDDIVWTGSWNPSQEMSIPNNVIIIQSRTLAAAYEAEFDELKDKKFHGGAKGSAKVILNENLTEAYFCPEDDCKEQVMRALDAAKKSIYFMMYSFTDDDIGNRIVKKAQDGVEVKGVFDPRKNQYSEYEKLKAHASIAKVHHKVFIIDDTIVITGSYNPSENGNKRNDENILIIRDERIAKEFTNEFKRFNSLD